MTRKEMYKAIKDNKLEAVANAEAYKTYRYHGTNYTNLSNDALLRILDTVKTKKSKKTISTQKGCVDAGARKAIKAIAATLNLKGIEKNFE